jgi:hypothetical protein
MPITLKELADFQTTTFDKATTYSKLILGLGYAGFFTAWSGSKQHLSPKALVGSALCVTVSLVLFLIFEMINAAVMSHLAVEFAQMPMGSEAEAEAEASFRKYRSKEKKFLKPVMRIWPAMFYSSAITGLSGAGILIYAFVAGLVRMW